MNASASCKGWHHDAVVLPDGSTVYACSFPAGRSIPKPLPDFGLYLDPRWQPRWAHRHVDWPDFGLPTAPEDLDDAIDDLLGRAQQGDVAAIGCLGGHGRTGTALAIAAIKAGLAQDAVTWVRSSYCGRAIETSEQEAFVRSHQSRSDPPARPV